MPDHVDPLSRAFGEVLRRYRQDAELSQEALASRARIDRTYVSMLERGMKSPTLKTIAALAGVLEASPHVLIRAAEKQAEASE